MPEPYTTDQFLWVFVLGMFAGVALVGLCFAIKWAIRLWRKAPPRFTHISFGLVEDWQRDQGTAFRPSYGGRR